MTETATVSLETAAVATATTTAKAAKTKATGNLIHDVAVEIEGLSKTKALNAADKLAEDIEANYFRLGGVLKLILKEQWFEGYPNFESYVYEKFGFGKRKGDYLISIYTNLVDKQIPWEKVSHLGWTKLKDLAPILTLVNLDEWVAKATPCTVMELQAMLKATVGGEATSGKTTSDTTSLKFTVHNDQAEVIQGALAKAKGELATDHDNVALAGVCSGYLANVYAVAGAAPDAAPIDFVAEFTKLGYVEVLGLFEKAFPLIELSVDIAVHEASMAMKAA